MTPIVSNMVFRDAVLGELESDPEVIAKHASPAARVCSSADCLSAHSNSPITSRRATSDAGGRLADCACVRRRAMLAQPKAQRPREGR
jgi:hypothetical protein